MIPDASTSAAQVRGAGYCSHPIRLQGQVEAVDSGTGEIRRVFDSANQPGGVLLVACRNRRATRCVACSEMYRGDAWHLITAGLRGGKGVSPGVTAHPKVFLTLTAPSFGAVHSLRSDGGRHRRCRPRRSGECAHGRPRGCRMVHGSSDHLLGQPLCADCFAYEQAVLWNASAGALWNRTVIAIRRGLARRIDVPVQHLSSFAQLSFVKVVEYQARGVVHLHAVIRLDGPTVASVPPDELDAGTLARIAIDTAKAVQVPCALPDGSRWSARWGTQVDARVIDTQGRADGVAGYIAKYATKSIDGGGALDRRIWSTSEIERLRVNEHLRRMVRTCWVLGGDARFRKLRLRAWAHTLGYRGHWTTKSRQYSTTFAALRTARSVHAGAPGPADHELRLAAWRYAGRGYQLRGA